MNWTAEEGPQTKAAIRAYSILLLLLLAATSGFSAPVVSNVRANQRTDGSGMVDIYYDLSGGRELMKVRVVFSTDNGATWNITPNPASVMGSVGAGVNNGTNRHITWDAANDHPEVRWPQAKAKVIAEEYTPGPTVVVNLPGTATLELVRIPAGSFQMGSNDPGWSNSNELPVHAVTINYDFWMCKYEVTQGQWKALMGSNPCSVYGVGDIYPVYNVSWNDVNEPGGFVQQLTDYVQSTGQGTGTFRLPSEAEWEYACRAGSMTRYYFGNSTCNLGGSYLCDLNSYAWYNGNNSPFETKPVGRKLPNAFGLYDMHGNVWEWCLDWWHGSYDNAPADGSAWITDGHYNRVLRGGCWERNPADCRSASRNNNSPDYPSATYGFRLVRTQ